MEEIIDTRHVHVRASCEHLLVEIVWKEHCDSGNFRKIVAEVMRFAKKQGITRWLCDMRWLQCLLLADQNWLTAELLSALTFVEAAEYRIAYLISPANLELMSSLGIRDTAQRDPQLRKHFEVGLFRSREQALVWLNCALLPK